MTSSDSTAALREYTMALLPWKLGDAAAPPEESDASAHLPRLLRAATRAPREHVLLLGFGNGRLGAALAAALPPGRTLTVCTLNPEAVRHAAGESPAWWTDGRHTVLADTSPRALLLLLHAFGRNPAASTLMLNPALSAADREAHQRLQRLLLSTERLDFDNPPPRHPGLCTLSAAAILHPDEPGLAAFFAQFPASLRELIVIWDADAPPDGRMDAACPTRHLARRLDADFAAQRNAALHEAAGDWVLFLDGDERLAGEDWERLPAVLARAADLGAGGVAWPRATFWPDTEHVLAGLGLWPDLQLRLLRMGPQLHFERPVHEVAAGLAGPVLIDAGGQILHLSRLLKDRDALAAKLRTFDAAAGHEHHRLNEAYPTLPAKFLQRVTASFTPRSLLRLKPV